MKNKNAITILELLITLMITTLVMGLLVVVFIAGSNVYNEEISESLALSEANKAINSLKNDLRSCLEITSASSNSITFWAEDFNNNGTKEASELFSYSWSGVANDPLIKTENGQSYMVAKNLKNFQLTYNSPILSSITQVNILAVAGNSGQLATFETSVKLRNI